MRLFFIRGTEIRCGALLLALAPAALILAGPRLFLVASLSLTVHEAAHAMAAHRLGYSVVSVELMPFGFTARLDCAEAPPMDAAAIFMAGPVASLSMAAMSALMEDLVPVYAASRLPLMGFNLVTAAVNLIPALPLDGGRLAYSIAGSGGKRAAFAILKAAGAAAGALLITAFILLLSGGAFNPTLAFMGVFLVTAALKERPPSALPKRKTLRGSPVTVRALAMAEETPLYSALSSLPAGGYAVVSVIGGGGRLVMQLDEGRLWEAASLIGAAGKLSDAVALYRGGMV